MSEIGIFDENAMLSPTSIAAATLSPEQYLRLCERLRQEVLDGMKQAFIGKDEVIDLLGLCLVAGENLFILGPPGTAKSALVIDLGRRLVGPTFEYLLTRFTEPNELFGPFDIRRLREGELVTNTAGMLPEASLVFLDELLNANSAILNSLLMVLNERKFRRGRETRQLPLLMVVGASNHLPEDEALGALFDRFLLRVRCDNVPVERLEEVLDAGWRLEFPGSHGVGDRVSQRHDHEPNNGEAAATTKPEPLHIDELRQLQWALGQVHLATVRPFFTRLVQQVRNAGLPLSDRRAVKLQRLVAASALLCGRWTAQLSDLWIFRYIWDREEQREVLHALVRHLFDQHLDQSTAADAATTAKGEHERFHPLARLPERPDPERLAQDLDRIQQQTQQLPASALKERAQLQDRLAALATQVEWIQGEHERAYLQTQLQKAWQLLGGDTP